MRAVHVAISILLLAIVSWMAGSEASAQCLPASNEDLLETRNGLGGNRLGFAVDLDGGLAAASAHLDWGAGEESGAVHVYRLEGSTWVHEAKLVPSDAEAEEMFGFSLALSGNALLVGARWGDSTVESSGSAYVFRRTSPGVWIEEAKLVADDPADVDQFGRAVALDGDTAVVGAPRRDTAGDNAGAVYVFTRSSGAWSLEAELTASDAEAGAELGRAVAVAGDTLLAGAPNDDASGEDAGAVYAFRRFGGTWSQEAKITSAAPSPGDRFGFSVALDAETAVIGAVGAADVGQAGGAAYVFGRVGGTWSQEAKLLASDGAAWDQFGRSVAVSSGTAVIGAWHHDAGAADAGAAYVFVNDGGGWRQEAKLTAPGGAAQDSLGVAVALDGDRALTGAFKVNQDGEEAGAAYMFLRSGSVWELEQWLLSNEDPITTLAGYRLALDGDTVLVGSPTKSFFSPAASESVGVYVRSGPGWIEQARLAPSDLSARDRFGFSLDLEGDLAAIAAFEQDSRGINAGAVYLFRRSGSVWSQEAKIWPETFAEGDLFGVCVAFSNGRLLIGAPLEDESGSNSGAAYVFRDEGGGWVEEARLRPSISQRDGFFGASCDLDGDRAVVGAPGTDMSLVYTDAGAVYVFHESNGVWSEEALLYGEKESYADFGFRVDLDGDLLAIGSPGWEDVWGASSVGSVYVFRLQGGDWLLERMIPNPDLYDSSAEFGRSIALHQGRLAAGAPDSDLDGEGIGWVRVYLDAGGGAWEEQVLLTPSASRREPWLGYGHSVALGSDALLVGARRDANQIYGSTFSYTCAEVDCADFVDGDLDGLPDCADGDCARDPACAGIDFDGDGVVNGDDCDPTDDRLFEVPEEVERLWVRRLKQGDKLVELSWSPAPGNGGDNRATIYQVATGFIDPVYGDQIGNLACWARVRNGTSIQDDRDLPDGSDLGTGEEVGFRYLVRGVNDCGPPPTVGWGTDSNGNERPTCP